MKKHSVVKKIILVSFLVLSLVVMQYLFFEAKATADTLFYLESSETVFVETRKLAQTEYVYFAPIDSPNQKSIIIYQGGKVSHLAYARLAFSLAEKGFTVYLPKMLFSLAFFQASLANQFIASFEATSWILLGHSLGGVAMSSVIVENLQITGAIYLASYPYAKGSYDHVMSLLIHAELDGLTSQAEIESRLSFLPENKRRFEVILGGNHAGFGDYGLQSGDGFAIITTEAQIQRTVELILDTFGR